MVREPINNGLLQSDLDCAGFNLLHFSGGGGGSGVADSGLAQLTPGQSYVDVTFSTPQPDAGWILIGSSVANTIDGTPLSVWPTTMTNKTASGFRVQLNAVADSVNYYLQWAIALGSLILPLPPSPPVLTRYSGNPIINYGGGGWKDSQVNEPCIFVDPTDASKLIMLFSAMAAPVSVGTMGIGIATASVSNPYTWTQCAANPFIHDTSRRIDSVVLVGTTFYVYSTNVSSNKIDMFTSTNLTYASAVAGTATFSLTSNVLAAAGDEVVVSQGSVIREDATHWYMAYCYRGGTGGVLPGIRIATSSDGIAWTNGTVDIISKGAPGSSDSTYIEWHQFVKIGGLYTITYEGFNGTSWAAHMAKSATIPGGWAKSSHNPVLAGSGVAGPDRYHIATPAWYQIGSTWYLYYQGSPTDPAVTDYSHANWSMCMATSSGTPLAFFP